MVTVLILRPKHVDSCDTRPNDPERKEENGSRRMREEGAATGVCVASAERETIEHAVGWAYDGRRVRTLRPAGGCE